MPSRPQNAFLRLLNEESFGSMDPHLTPYALTQALVLYRPEDGVDWIYFPENALLSVLTTSPEGDVVETAMIGNEGAAGVLECLGSQVTLMTTLVQVGGAGLRMQAGVFRALVGDDPELLAHTFRLLEVQMNESRQSGMCLAVHTVEQRLARWLLESMERCGGRVTLPLTQEFLSAMLGVQRTTVTAFAKELQKVGLMRTVRGKIELLDVAGLERRACSCRQTVLGQRKQLGLQPLPVSNVLPIKS